jgi:electron transport complex protein RnfB
MKTAVTSEQIDALLPQTQCGDCGYQGCLPYAQAIIGQAETIDKCLPGGIQTLTALGQLLQQDSAVYVENLKQKSKPKRLAIIREQDCIGCTKCIQACPVDAIFGSGKVMHTVIASECTGCGLCVPPCPVDCIDLIVTEDQNYDSNHYRKRYENRNQRLAKKNNNTIIIPAKVDRKAEIAAAIARVQAKKNTL